MDFQTAFQMIYNRAPTLSDYSASMYDQGQSIINQAMALQNQINTDVVESEPDQIVEGVMGTNEPYQGTILDTLFESSQYYADSPMGQSHNAVPYTTDYVPVAVQQALEAEANQDVTPVFNPVENLTQAVSGLNFMPTNLTGQFFGINPTTNAVELMSNMNSNPVFRSGVAGFINQLPTGFEFGTPKVYRNISSYTPETFEEFVEQKKAEEAEAQKNRYTFTGMGGDFDQSRLNETYNKP